MSSSSQDVVPVSPHSGSRSRVVDALIFLFGVSSWVAINGLWVQTPLLVNTLPEGWELPSYIVIITQVANVGPAIFSYVRNRNIPNIEVISIHVILFLGTVCCFLLAQFWDSVVVFADGSNHGISFMILTGMLAITDCTSSVTYFPFISNFKDVYLSSLMVGEGFSGLIPSFVALVQGVGGNPSCVNSTALDGSIHRKAIYPPPLFSVDIFFIFLGCLMVLSWVSFHILNVSPIGRREVANELEHNRQEVISAARIVPKEATGSTEGSSEMLIGVELSKNRLLCLLFGQAYCCFITNGVLSAIQSYGSLPYGNQAYHFATILSVISGPTTVFFVFMIHSAKNFQKPIIPVGILGSSFAAFIIYLALSSPHPPFQGTTGGTAMVVIVWVVYHASFSYVKACIAGTLRNCKTSMGGKKSLFYFGVFTQMGSFVGAAFIFTIMKLCKCFHSYNPCA